METIKPLEKHIVGIGDIYVSARPVVLSCIGLGSCVALFLFDKVKKIAGVGHIMLPKYSSMHQEAENKLKYAKDAIDELVERIGKLGGNSKALRAIIVGGAKMYKNDPMNIGQRNISEVKLQLLERGIYIYKKEVGGCISRSVEFDMATGQVHIKSELNKIII